MAYILPLILAIFLGLSLPVIAQPVVTSTDTEVIVEDSFFRTGFSFTADDIQAFLNEKGEDCKGEDCLKDYRSPRSDESAAQIISQVARELGLHPGVILITLQKENSLVTQEEPESWRYRTAMGYGCPDDADCEGDYFGFENQVRLGATLLRVGYDRACGDKTSFLGWRVAPRWYRGHTTTIDGRPTKLGTCATAALYNYTPHRADSALRPAASDNQYYYGNYNFVYFYKQWFAGN